jgi:GNAT superfamily N-acetyltransferase
MTGLRLRYLQFRERARERGFLGTCWFALYRSQEAVPVEKDLSTLKPVPRTPPSALQLLELGPETFGSHRLEYPIASRRARVDRYLRRGYRTVVMADGGKVIADLWYVSRRSARTASIHPHLRWFGIHLGSDDVYMFDMHVDAAARGGGLATYFMSRALHHLRDLGSCTAFGYFDAHYTPALWVHRQLGFRELPRVTIRKCLWFESASRQAHAANRSGPLAAGPRQETDAPGRSG